MAVENRLMYFLMPVWEGPGCSVWMCLKWIFLCFKQQTGQKEDYDYCNLLSHTPAQSSEIEVKVGSKTVTVDGWIALNYVTYIYFFRIFSLTGYYTILSRVPCTIQQVPADYIFYMCSMYMLIPNSSFIHLLPFPFSNHTFVFYVCLFLFCK